MNHERLHIRHIGKQREQLQMIDEVFCGLLVSLDLECKDGATTAFFIGNEGKGLTDQAAEAADCLIRIPMCGKVESLNAAMASGILMYEAARQRRE